MSVFSYLSALVRGAAKIKPAGSRNRRAKYLNVRIALIAVILGGISYVVVKSGAQELKSSDAAEKPKKHLNQDVRVNGQENLNRVLQKSLADKGKNSAAIIKDARTQAVKINAALAGLKKENPTVEVTLSSETGNVEVVRSATSLTGPNFGVSGEKIVRDFIQENKQLYGLEKQDIADLHFVGESVSEVSGMRMVIVEQMVNDRLVFQSDTKFILDRDGRLIQSVGRIVPNASASAASLENLMSPQDALKATMETVGVSLETEAMSKADVEPDSLKVQLKTNNPAIKGDVTSTIVYFPAAPGVLVPAWSQTIFSTDADYYALVDATDGTLLYRKNIRAEASTQQARFRVYAQADGTPADSPAPQSPSLAVVGAGTQPAGIAPSIINMLTVQNILASPNGWIDDCPAGGCTATQTQTQGNNTIICLDRTGTTAANGADVCDTDAASVLDGNGMPMGNPDVNSRNRDFLGTTPRDFQTNYLPPPQGGNPESGQTATGAGTGGTAAIDQFRRGAVTQLFYLTNFYHDKLYTLGFTPAARNFQTNNFGGGGTGNDRVLGDAQDASGTDNANFSTPPDGTSGRMQMYRFTGPTVDRDGSLDAEIVLHELTHGTSNRLIGNGAGLNWDVGAGMGEGWSDYYALSILNNTNADDPNGKYASGAYATYKLGDLLDNYVYGIRRFPYSTNNSVNPLTWADIDQTTYNESGGIAPSPLGFGGNGAMEVHNIGEIWANTLWEVRSRVIADPAGANGNVPTGNTTMLGIVTDGLKMTPTDPSFIQARDALIDADCATNACANESSIWAGFADRGLGYNAVAPLAKIFGLSSGHMGIKESFQTPNLDVNSFTIDDTTLGFGNSSGAVDPGETIKLTVNLKNPLRRASSSATGITTTLTTSTAGVTILDNSSSYSTIAPQGNAAGDTFTFRVPTSMPCGSSLKFTITTNSSLGTSTKDFAVRLGSPSGTGTPVTYTNSTAIAIPDNSPSGVASTLNITDDYEIADLDFRVNSLTHTWVGDITMELKSPSGYGTDLISVIGCGVLSQCNSGDNLTNTVIDQTAATPNDLLSAAVAQAPFTDDFLPIFNAASWSSIGFPTDTTGQLSRYNGLSTQGTWTVLVSDQVAGDTGTLNSWSMIVTPRNFACTSFTPTGIEGDVQNRPGGDTFVDADDVAQIRRFSLGIDLPYQGNEFQRADTSPRSQSGEGIVDGDDVQQARRYSVGSDTNLIAGGPASPAPIAPPVTDLSVKGKSLIRTKDGVQAAPSAFRVDAQNTSAGASLVVPIRVDTVGNEAGYTFSIAFDSTKLTNPVVVIGNSGGDVLFNANNPGQIGFSVTTFSGGTIAEGNNKTLVTVTFTVAAGAAAGTTPITFTDTPARRKASPVDPNFPITQPTYTGGTITIGGATAAGANLSGRVLTDKGRGVANAQVIITNSAGEVVKTARTNGFGYYRLTEVEAGASYIVRVESKQYKFEVRTINVAQDIDGIDFTAQPR